MYQNNKNMIFYDNIKKPLTLSESSSSISIPGEVVFLVLRDSRTKENLNKLVDTMPFRCTQIQQIYSLYGTGGTDVGRNT